MLLLLDFWIYRFPYSNRSNIPETGSTKIKKTDSYGTRN